MATTVNDQGDQHLVVHSLTVHSGINSPEMGAIKTKVIRSQADIEQIGVDLTARPTYEEIPDLAVTQIYEVRYKRSATAPATPTGDDPAGWTVAIPSGTDLLWLSGVLKNPDGTIVAGNSWSTPERSTGIDGATGVPGLNSATVHLYKRAASAPTKPTVASTYTFATGVLTGQDGGWTQAVPAADGNPLWVTLATAAATTATDSIAAAEWSTPTIIAQDGEQGPQGIQGIQGIQGVPGPDGSPAIVGVLSNEAHTVPTLADGTGGIYTGCASTASVFKGAVDDSANWACSAAPSSGVAGSLAGKTYTVSNMTVDAGYVDFTLTRSGYPTIVLRFTITKAKQGVLGDTGAPGAAATAYWIVPTAAAIAKSLAGAYTPASITFDAKSATGAGSPAAYAGRWIIATYDGATWTDRYTSAANEATKAYTPPAGITALRARLYLAGGTTTLLDEETIPIVADGPTGPSGGNTAIVYLYQRKATVPAVTDIADPVTYTFASKSITSGSLGAWSQTIPAGTDPLYVIAATAYGTGTTDTIARSEWSSPQILAQNGATGARTASIELYKWDSAAPTVFPVGTSTYTWATGVFTNPATLNGWTQTPGAGTAGQKLYAVRAVYSDSGTSATSTITWPASPTPFVVGQAGTNGVNGSRTAILELYKWASSVPTTFPAGMSTYTWATGAFTDPATLNGWAKNPGAGAAGQTLYACRAIYSDTGTSATSTVKWPSSGQVAYPVGYSGLDGATGPRGATGPLLAIKANFSAYASANLGECYVHGYNVDGTPGDVNGLIQFGSTLYTVLKGMLNPNVAGKYVIVLELSTGKIATARYNYSSNVFTTAGASEALASGLTVDDATYVIIGRYEADTGENIKSASLFPAAMTFAEYRTALFAEIFFAGNGISQADFDAMISNLGITVFTKLAANTGFFQSLMTQFLQVLGSFRAGTRFDTSGNVVSGHEGDTGAFIGADGRFLLEGPDLSITKDRARFYKGAGVQRRALQLGDESLDFLDCPDTSPASPEQLRARIGRLGVGSAVLMDGEFNAPLVQPKGPETSIISASVASLDIIIWNGEIRILYVLYSDYYVREIVDSGSGFSVPVVISSATLGSPSPNAKYLLDIDGSLIVAYKMSSGLKIRVDGGSGYSAEETIATPTGNVVRAALLNNVPSIMVTDSNYFTTQFSKISGVWTNVGSHNIGYNPTFATSRDKELWSFASGGATTKRLYIAKFNGSTWDGQFVGDTEPYALSVEGVIERLDGTFDVLYYIFSSKKTYIVNIDNYTINSKTEIDSCDMLAASFSADSMHVVYANGAVVKYYKHNEYARVGAGIIESGGTGAPGDAHYEKYSNGYARVWGRAWQSTSNARSTTRTYNITLPINLKADLWTLEASWSHGVAPIDYHAVIGARPTAGSKVSGVATSANVNGAAQTGYGYINWHAEGMYE